MMYYDTSFVSCSTQATATPLAAKLHLQLPHQNTFSDMSLLYFVSSTTAAVTGNLLRDVTPPKETVNREPLL